MRFTPAGRDRLFYSLFERIGLIRGTVGTGIYGPVDLDIIRDRAAIPEPWMPGYAEYIRRRDAGLEGSEKWLADAIARGRSVQPKPLRPLTRAEAIRKRAGGYADDLPGSPGVALPPLHDAKEETRRLQRAFFDRHPRLRRQYEAAIGERRSYLEGRLSPVARQMAGYEDEIDNLERYIEEALKNNRIVTRSAQDRLFEVRKLLRPLRHEKSQLRQEFNEIEYARGLLYGAEPSYSSFDDVINRNYDLMGERRLFGHETAQMKRVREAIELKRQEYNSLFGLFGLSVSREERQKFRDETANMRKLRVQAEGRAREYDSLFQLYGTGAIPGPLEQTLGLRTGLGIPIARGELAGHVARISGEINIAQIVRQKYSGLLRYTEDAGFDDIRSGFQPGFRLHPENMVPANRLGQLTFNPVADQLEKRPSLYAFETGVDHNLLYGSAIREGMAEARISATGRSAQLERMNSTYLQKAMDITNERMSNVIRRHVAGAAIPSTPFSTSSTEALGVYQSILRPGETVTAQRLVEELLGGAFAGGTTGKDVYGRAGRYSAVLRELLFEKHRGNAFATSVLDYMDDIAPGTTAFRVGKGAKGLWVQRGFWKSYKQAVGGMDPLLRPGAYQRSVMQVQRNLREAGRVGSDLELSAEAAFRQVEEGAKSSFEEIMNSAWYYREAEAMATEHLGTGRVEDVNEAGRRLFEIGRTKARESADVIVRLKSQIISQQQQLADLNQQIKAYRSVFNTNNWTQEEDRRLRAQVQESRALISRLTKKIEIQYQHARSNGTLPGVKALVEQFEVPFVKADVHFRKKLLFGPQDLRDPSLHPIRASDTQRAAQDADEGLSAVIAREGMVGGHGRLRESLYEAAKEQLQTLAEAQMRDDILRHGDITNDSLMRLMRRAQELELAKKQGYKFSRDAVYADRVTEVQRRMTFEPLIRSAMSDALEKVHGWTPQMSSVFKDALAGGRHPLFGESAEDAFVNLSNAGTLDINAPGFAENWQKITGRPLKRFQGMRGEIADVRPLSLKENARPTFEHVGVTFDVLGDTSLEQRKELLAAWNLPEYIAQWKLHNKTNIFTKNGLLEAWAKEEALALAEAEIKSRGGLRVTQQFGFAPMLFSPTNMRSKSDAVQRAQAINVRYNQIHGRNVFGPQAFKKLDTLSDEDAIEFVMTREEKLLGLNKVEKNIHQALQRVYRGGGLWDEELQDMMEVLELSPTGKINQDLGAVAKLLTQGLRHSQLGMGMFVPEENSEALDVVAPIHYFGVDAERVIRTTMSQIGYKNTKAARRHAANLAAIRDTTIWGPEAMGQGYRYSSAAKVGVFDKQFAPSLGGSRFVDAWDPARKYLDEALQRRGLSVDILERLHNAFNGQFVNLNLNENDPLYLKKLAARKALGYGEEGPRTLYPIMARGGYLRLPGEEDMRGEDLYKSLGRIQFNELFNEDELVQLLANRGIRASRLPRGLEKRRKALLDRLAGYPPGPGASNLDIRPDTAAEEVAERLSRRVVDLFHEDVQAVLPADLRTRIFSALGPQEPLKRAQDAARVVESEVLAPTRTRVTMNTLKDFFRTNKDNLAVRTGVGAVGILAALGVIRSIRTRDHSPEDVMPATNTPGMSTYRGSYGTAGGYTPNEYPGVTYHVQARGAFDPVSFQNQLAQTTGGSVSGNVYNSRDRLKSQNINEVMRLYT